MYGNNVELISFAGVYTSLADASIWNFVQEVIQNKDTINLDGLEGHVCPPSMTSNFRPGIIYIFGRF
jgi:hypothetical protein